MLPHLLCNKQDEPLRKNWNVVVKKRIASVLYPFWTEISQLNRKVFEVQQFLPIHVTSYLYLVFL
jgi:hypothetical protein